MTKRLCIAIGILLAVIAGVLVWRGVGPKEPVYEGKPLSHWLEISYHSPGRERAAVALRHMGTNAIPTLLRMIRATDPPPVVLKLLALAGKQRLVRIHYLPAGERHFEADYGFEVLGTNAACAVPELVKIYEAARSPSSQQYAAFALAHIGQPAKAAIPALLRNFTHTNAQVRLDAVSAVSQIGGEPEVVVPAMRAVLKDPEPQVRWGASNALMYFGARSRSAAPELQAALADPVTSRYRGLKEQLEYALWMIAPEQVGKPLVVEESTPMVAEGVTTEALDVLFNGERRTLITPRRPTPCVTQFWDSEPRGPLALYRSASGTAEQDHFLGEFEVTGIAPPPSNVNVSVLCVIADQRIFLCARDNNRKELLEIRRVK